MTQSFPHLFSPLAIGPLTVKNRIFSTGHMTMMIEDGNPTDGFVAYHAARAAGGAGLIITEAARVHASSVTSGHAIDATRDDCIAAYRRTAEAVQAHGCAVFGQLSHAGRATYGGTQEPCWRPSAGSTPTPRWPTRPRPARRAWCSA